MKDRQSILVEETIRAMRASDATEAIATARRLNGHIWNGEGDGTDLEGLWQGFTDLLSRRGYFVSTRVELTHALGEIYGLGSEFDLYELAAVLAKIDNTLTECLQITPERRWPNLRQFSQKCVCGRHSAVRE